VNDDQRAEEIRHLETLVAGPAGALAFPVLAEAQRRAGRPDEAERVAREGLRRTPHATAGRVALALALLDQKRSDEARAELERLLGSDAEQAIAHQAVAAAAPEGIPARPGGAELRATGPIGEIATLDPYPEDPAFHSAEDPSREAPVPVWTDEPDGDGPFGPLPPPAPAEPLVFDAEGVRDDELDEAFEEAESDRDQMLGADDVARAAMAAVPDEDESDVELEPVPCELEPVPCELEPVPRADVADGEADFLRAIELARPPASPFATETVAGLLEQQGHAEAAGRLREQMATPASAGETLEAAPVTADVHRKQATLERWLENLRRDEP